MSDTETETIDADTVDATLTRINGDCIIPSPVRTETVQLLNKALGEGVIHAPVDPAMIGAAALLSKRGTEYITHHDAKQLAASAEEVSFKDILASVQRLAESPLDYPATKPSLTTFVEGVALAASSLDVQIEDDSKVSEWCDVTGLGKNGDVSTVIARQAALSVILRGTVFHKSMLASGATLTKSDYKDLVQQAHDRNGDLSPDWFVLDDVAMLFTEQTFQWLLELQDHVTVTENPSEFLGNAYEELIDQEERWRLGQFRTPETLATLVAELGVTDADDTVLAPGVGAGALAAAAARTKADAGHPNALQDIHAVDVSPLSVLLGSAALLSSDLGGRPSVSHEDFFELASESVSDVDVVLSNPPYTKHHELTPDEKSALNEQVERATGYSFSKLSPLYVYFTVYATEFLEDGDRAVFLTPAEMLNTKYGVDWKEFLLDHYDVNGFILFDQNGDSPFDGVATTSLITIAERRTKPSPDSITRCARVDEMPAVDTLASFFEWDVTQLGLTTEETEWGFVQDVYQESLSPTENWSTLFTETDFVIDDQLVPLEDLIRVTRGIATGQNSFFCLSEAERVGEGNGESWSIDTEFLAPIIRKSHNVPNYDYREADWEAQREDGVETWLLYHLSDLDWDSTYFKQEIADDVTSQQQLTEFSQADGGSERPMESEFSEPARNVIAYLKYGMQLENPPHQTHLAEQRDDWYVVEQRPPADILYTSMTRGRGRFVYNEMGARNLNNVHSLYVTADLSETSVKALLAYLNSEFADMIIKQSGRTLSSGMSKVEPGDLKNIPVIDPRVLDDSIVEDLARLFDSLCEAARNDDISEIEVREELQETLASFLKM